MFILFDVLLAKPKFFFANCLFCQVAKVFHRQHFPLYDILIAPRKWIYSKTCFELNDLSSAWAADIIAPAGMHFLCITLRYNKPNKSKTHKSILFVTVPLNLNFTLASTYS